VRNIHIISLDILVDEFFIVFVASSCVFVWAIRFLNARSTITERSVGFFSNTLNDV